MFLTTAAHSWPDERLLPRGKVGAKLLRVDLEAAGIPYADGDGRVADFHALRHTFLTNLAVSGVHPSVAQRLARHSDVNLTLSRYTHTALERQSEAVEALPDLLEEPATDMAAQERRGTGTDGLPVLASCLAKPVLSGKTQGDQFGRTLPSSTKTTNALKDPKEAVSRPSNTSRKLVPPRGLEPRTHGLRIRCSAS